MLGATENDDCIEDSASGRFERASRAPESGPAGFESPRGRLERTARAPRDAPTALREALGGSNTLDFEATLLDNARRNSTSRQDNSNKLGETPLRSYVLRRRSNKNGRRNCQRSVRSSLKPLGSKPLASHVASMSQGRSSSATKRLDVKATFFEQAREDGRRSGRRSARSSSKAVGSKPLESNEHARACICTGSH